jgi:hypothetical protein
MLPPPLPKLPVAAIVSVWLDPEMPETDMMIFSPADILEYKKPGLESFVVVLTFVKSFSKESSMSELVIVPSWI